MARTKDLIGIAVLRQALMNKAWGLIKLTPCIWGVLVLLLAIPVTASAISADPPSVNYGNLALNTTATQDIAITVDSGYFVMLAGGAIIPPFSFDGDTCILFTGPGTCNVKESFTPTAPGTFSDTLFISECPTGGGGTCIEVQIPVSGRGTTSNFPNLSIWGNTWFKVTITQREYHFDSQVVAPMPRLPVSSSSPAYLFISGDWYQSCCPERYGIVGTLYTQNSLGVWDVTSGIGLTFDYFAGTDLNFVASSVYGDANLEFEATILFKGVLNRGGDFVNFYTTLKTLGGSFTEIASGSTERWAGSFILSGGRIDESKVPPELNVPR